MNVSKALLIGIDHSTLAPPLAGAVQDVRDLAERLLARGLDPRALHLVTSPRLPDAILPGVSRSEATVAGVRAALTRAAADLSEEPVLVHISARGQRTGADARVLLQDAPLPLAALSEPFVAHPVRSVAVVVDAGFDGDPAPGERTWGPPAGPARLPALTDPTVLAGGLTHPVTERPIAGRIRGVFTRYLTALLADPATASWSFGELLAVLRRIPGESLSPVLLPPTDGAHLLAAPAPWRGVQAAWQWQPTHDFHGGTPGFYADHSVEQYDFGTGTAFPGGQFQVATTVGGGSPYPPGPGVTSFTNHDFDVGTPIPSPPSTTHADRIYQVTADYPLPGTVYVVFRNAATGTVQSAEWYMNAASPRIDSANGTVTYTESALPSATDWQNQGPWYNVTQQVQP